MNPIYLLTFGNISPPLEKMITAAKKNLSFVEIDCSKDDIIPELTNKKLLFAVELNSIGVNFYLLNMFCKLYLNSISLKGSVAGILLHSNSTLFTKSFAQTIIFLANSLGCSFIGHPLVEATGDYSNLLTWKKVFVDKSLEDICLILSLKLGKRLYDYEGLISKKDIIVLHASSYKTSNTLGLWNLVKENLRDFDIRELHVENGTVQDCKGCSYKTCLHYSMQNSCFYGGLMVKEIMPAIEKCSNLILLCPNYNDSVSANICAVINRLTALYRKINFYEKNIFSIIISGNSGGDCVAKQLIGSLNINKGFFLPGNFCLMEISNDPGDILKKNCIKDKALSFSNIIRNVI